MAPIAEHLVVSMMLLFGTVAPAKPPAAPPAPAAKADAVPARAAAPAQPPGNPPGAPPPAAGRAPLPPIEQIRELHGQEYSNAVEARDSADLLRAAYEKAQSARRIAKAPPPPAGAADVEFDRVVAAYRKAIADYPGTQIEHQCRIRLGGAYQFHGDFDAALNELKLDAERFANTKLGPESMQSVALTYLQAKHDPAQARVWFTKLKIAAAAIKDENERAKWEAAASEGLTRCDQELAGGKK